MSIQKVARQAGVSIATVSRVFNMPDTVTPAMRERVQQAAKALGYVPNTTARTLRMRRSKVLGVVLPTLLNPVFAECLEGIAAAAEAGGYAIVPVTTDYKLENEEAAVKRLLGENVDGLILVVSSPETSTALQTLRAREVPYVLLYNRHPAHPCISVDGEEAVAALVRRLAALGHRRIAMVSGQLAASDRAQQRHRGYVRGMNDAGLPVCDLVEVPFMDTAVATLADFLRTPSRPTALVCSNDLLAIRCLRAAHVAGLRVPDELSVVGFDGIELTNDLTPILSTITQPNREMGRSSVQLVVAALAAGRMPEVAESRTFAHGFRDGESCSPNHERTT